MRYGPVVEVGVLEQPADPRVAQRRERSCLPLETLTGLLIDDGVGGEDLDRDGTIDARIEALVDFAHSASAERADHFVGAEPRSGNEHWTHIIALAGPA